MLIIFAAAPVASALQGRQGVSTRRRVTKPRDIVVVVPTYNEKDNLPLLAQGILAHTGFRLLVVDDGSPDKYPVHWRTTWRVLSGRVEVMHRTGPRGLGGSYVDGLQRALESGADVIFQMDADLSHNPEHLPTLLAASDTYDVVIGSRYLMGVSVVNWPLHRIFLSAFANRYIRAVTRISVTDCTSEFRCWRREALARLPLKSMVSNGYAFIVEMLFEASRRGCSIGEAPIIFIERHQGQSKVSGKVLFESLIVRGGCCFADALDQARRRNGDDVVSRFPGDSVGTFMEPIAKSIAARGHDVHIVAPWHPWSRAVARKMASRFTTSAPLPSLNVFGYAAALRLDVSLRAAACIAAPLALAQGWRIARKIARRHHASVMHGHWVVPGGITAALAAPALPLVISLHGSDVYVAETFAPARAAARAAAFRRAGAVTACSADLARRAVAIGADSARIEIVPYGVDVDCFRPDRVVRLERRKRLGIDADAALIFTAGRLVRKGFEYLIDAMPARSVRRDSRDWR